MLLTTQTLFAALWAVNSNTQQEKIRTYIRKTIDIFLAICYTICMKENLIYARTCVYNINYHVVWSVKYRRKVLTSNIEARLKEIAQDTAAEKGFVIHLLEVGEKDHVHAFLSGHPKVSVSYMVKMLKGITGRKLLYEFPELKEKLWKGQLWNSSYYVETVGSVSEESTRAYIEKQKKGDSIQVSV